MRPSHTRLVCHMIWDRRAGYARRPPRKILCRSKRRRVLPDGRAPCYNGRGSTDTQKRIGGYAHEIHRSGYRLEILSRNDRGTALHDDLPQKSGGRGLCRARLQRRPLAGRDAAPRLGGRAPLRRGRQQPSWPPRRHRRGHGRRGSRQGALPPRAVGRLVPPHVRRARRVARPARLRRVRRHIPRQPRLYQRPVYRPARKRLHRFPL